MCFVNAENSGRHVRESMVGQPFVRHLPRRLRDGGYGKTRPTVRSPLPPPSARRRLRKARIDKAPGGHSNSPHPRQIMTRQTMARQRWSYHCGSGRHVSRKALAPGDSTSDSLPHLLQSAPEFHPISACVRECTRGSPSCSGWPRDVPPRYPCTELSFLLTMVRSWREESTGLRRPTSQRSAATISLFSASDSSRV